MVKKTINLTVFVCALLISESVFIQDSYADVLCYSKSLIKNLNRSSVLLYKGSKCPTGYKVVENNAQDGATGPIGASGVSGPVGSTGQSGSDGQIGATGVSGLDGAAGATGFTGANGLTGSTGVSGAIGFTGVAGSNGAAGATGISGSVGATGVAGTNGLTGATGVAGTNGLAGATGVSGAVGFTGVAGNNGAVGATGIAGTNGAVGFTGAAGTNGLAGATGIAGTNGLIGATGVAGSNGATGFTGAPGADGATGSAGTNGAIGATGAAGSNGLTGATGINGATGIDGAVGFTGAAGSNGSTGPVGATGAQGLTWQGEWAEGVAYVRNDVVYYHGSAYITYSSLVSDSGNSPSNDNIWYLLASAGATGVTGATGAAGSNGTNGSTGPTGPVGATGAQGLTWQGEWAEGVAYVRNDVVYYHGSAYITYSSLVSDSGNSPSNDNIWYLLASAGATGVTGATGAAGSNGTNGSTGPTGPVGATGAQGLNWQGEWAEGIAYTRNDVVYFHGSSYITYSSLVSDSGNGPLNNNIWYPLASAGGAGVTGATGAAGTNGTNGSAGPTGPVGATGAQGLTWQGEWAEGIAYTRNDVVYYQGSAYITYSSLVSDSGNGPSNNNIWYLLASAGATGVTGATGAAGSNGTNGSTGPTGPVGATGAQGLTWQGEWAEGIAYTRNDVVYYQGSSYITYSSLVSNSGNGPLNNNIWYPLANAGGTGATGIAGTNGGVGATGPGGARGSTGATGSDGSNSFIFRGGTGSDVLPTSGAQYFNLTQMAGAGFSSESDARHLGTLAGQNCSQVEYRIIFDDNNGTGALSIGNADLGSGSSPNYSQICITSSNGCSGTANINVSADKTIFLRYEAYDGAAPVTMQWVIRCINNNLPEV